MQTAPVKSTYRQASWIAGAATLVVLGSGIAFGTFRKIESAAAERQHIRLVLTGAERLLSKVKDAETASRGFALTGDDQFLKPYLAVRDELSPDLVALRALTAIPAADAHLAMFKPLMEARLAHLKSVVEVRRTRGLVAASELVRDGTGDRLMAAMREEMRGFMEIEEAAQLEHDAAFQQQMRRLAALLLAICVLAILSAAAFAVMFSRAAKQRERNAVLVETQRLLALQEETGRQLQLANITLQVSEERLAVTLNSIGDAVVATDELGRVTQLNPLAERLTGWTHALAMGRPVDEIITLVNADTRLPATIPVAETLAKGTLQGLANHTVLIARDGGECPIADSCAPIRDRQGRVVGAVLVFRDVTEEYAAQQALRDTNLALEVARAEAVRANLAKSDFLSNMSHEIRTPMNAIIGMSYLALKSDLSPRVREHLRVIQDSGRHLLGIINDILDISKIEAGKLTVESTEFTLEKVLENVAAMIATKASGKGLELVFAVDPDVPANLVGDPLRLGQVLINFGNNAVKFTERGEIAIAIRVLERTEDGVVLHFTVRDTGIGLSRAEMERLFQNFSQADASTTRRFGGTGLGLVISKKLAELMGGTVGVESVVGAGSTFWFTAHFGIGAGHVLPAALSVEQRGLRVLVVDDNASARAVLSDLLVSLTFVADQVESGTEAIAAVTRADQQGKPYAIVLLDWQMPGIDGIETARQLHELPLRPMPHLLMVTAYGFAEVLEGAEEVGIEGVLIKPVSASALFDSISRLLGGAPAGPRTTGEIRLDTLDRLSTIKGARILLVEDNEVNQLVATELLRDAGFVVDLAENGRIALDRIGSAPYDVVLMDMQMPVMDGVTATIELRKDARYATLPVIAMTANALQADRERCIAAGMNAHVAKPIEPEDLWTALLAWTAPKTLVLDPLPDPLPDKTSRGASGDDDLPTEIAGLDTVIGLRRGLGKHALYLSMLRGFVSGQRDALTETRHALDAADWDSAERHAHTLKGVAANVGATEIPDLAKALEASIRARLPRAEVNARLDALQTPLATLVTALDRRLPAMPLLEPFEIGGVVRETSSLQLALPPSTVPETTATILVVDDSPDNLMLMREMLKDTYRVRTANSGEQALGIARSATPPDLILLDIMMPGMDGYEVCRRLGTDASTAHIPVVFLTASTEEEDERRGLELGAVDYIVKPASAPIVRARVHNHLALKAMTNVMREKNVELEQARVVADKANLAKSEFLSRMSHELRSPLNAVIGFAQLMETDTPPPTESQRESLKLILQGGWYLLTLINEILDLAVIESGQLTPLMEPVRLSELVPECRDMMSDLARRRTVTIHSPPLDPLLLVYADRTRLKQVLINLLSNAIKYNREGGTVTIACERLNAARVRISVTDTGEGLTPPQQARLFESFNRLGREQGHEQGTGIGLVVSKRLIELMNGRIGVDSTVGVGSTFWLELGTESDPLVGVDSETIEAASV